MLEIPHRYIYVAAVKRLELVVGALLHTLRPTSHGQNACRYCSSVARDQFTLETTRAMSLKWRLLRYMESGLGQLGIYVLIQSVLLLRLAVPV